MARRKRRKFGTRAERKAAHLAKKTQRAAKRIKRASRITRRISNGKATMRERSQGRRVAALLAANIQASARRTSARSRVKSASTDDIFGTQIPGKIFKGGAKSGSPIIDDIMGFGGVGGKGKGPASGGTQGYSGLAMRYFKTSQGRMRAKQAAGVAAVAVAGYVADQAVEYMVQSATSRMGTGVSPETQKLNRKFSLQGVGVYFRNKLIGLMTDEQYDAFWVSAATHIRNQLKAL